MDLPQAVLDSADITAITQLVLTERESRDLGRWARMRDCFHPDSIVRISWFRGNGHEFVERSIDMARRNVLAKHRLAPPAVRLSGKRAVVTFVGIIDIPATLSGVQVQLSSYARFFYRVENRDERWRLGSFEAIYMRDEINPVIPGERVPVTREQVASFRPSYRMLSFLLTSNGYQVDHELPGEDRPESAEAFMQEIYGWAGLEP